MKDAVGEGKTHFRSSLSTVGVVGQAPSMVWPSCDRSHEWAVPLARGQETAKEERGKEITEPEKKR
jgi:hypothetical protein